MNTNNDLKQAAIDSYPNEMCGFLLKDGRFIHCLNKADDPAKAFKIDAVDYARHIGNIEFVIHTHIPGKMAMVFDPRTPSYQDMVGQKATGLPWLIFSCDGDNVSEPLQIPRVPNNNYLDRPFIWFVSDCYSLVQDYYRFELNIILPDHKADKPFNEITHMNDIFTGYLDEYGFKAVQTIDDIKNGDLLLLDSMTFKSNHLGIFHDGFVIHQGPLSVKEPFEHFIGRINAVLKYVN